MGRPIVTTDFAALDRWRDLVSVAEGADQFEAATGKTVELDERLRRLEGESWDAKADLEARRLAETPISRWSALPDPSRRVGLFPAEFTGNRPLIAPGHPPSVR